MEEKNLQETPERTIEDVDKLSAQEVETERTQFGKVFAFGGNRFQGVTYSEPVHQFSRETGKWEDIDATFRPVEDEVGQERLEATAGDLTVSCGVSGPEPFVTITDSQGRQMAWGLEEAAAITPKAAEQLPIPPAKTVRELRENAMARLYHQVTYPEIFPGVDMVCQSGTRVKDEFVFSAPEAVRPIVYQIEAPGMAFEKLDDDQVIVKDESGEMAFRFPAPYLKDAEGKNGTVHVTLEPLEEGCRMICLPDQEFKETAAYPVVMDPAVYTAQDSSGIVDTFVCQGYTTNFSGYTDLWVSNNSAYGIMNSYLRVQTLPALSSSHFITSAKICLLPSFAGSYEEGTLVLAREATSSWNPSTITYAAQPSLSNVYQDGYLMAYNNYGWVEFDVTALARKWYAGDNKGIALVPDPSVTAIVGFHSSENTTKPYFVVNYSSLAGLEDYLAYDSQSAGRAGAGFVSLHNGNLIFAHGDTAMNGARLPVSVTHYYNSCDADKNDFYMGKGWKTSLHQTLHKALLNSTVYYVYTDGDGTQHYFESANSSNTEYKDMSGLSLKLVPGNPTTITDKGDNVMTFPQITATPTASAPTTTRVLMTKMQDAKGNQITIAATGLKITSVTDGAGRVTSFDYTGSLCTAIRTPWQTASSCTRFTYTGSKLAQVTYEDGKTSSLVYSDVGSFSLLASATGPEGYQAAYAYTAANVSSGLPHYISRQS